jgi:hypothetical protein
VRSDLGIEATSRGKPEFPREEEEEEEDLDSE